MGSRKLMVVAVAMLVLAACGTSTKHTGGPTGGGGVQSGGSGGNGPNGTDTNGSASPSDTGATAGSGAGGAAGSGGSSSSGGSGGAQSAFGSVGGGGAQAGSVGADGPGITATTINIAAAYDPDAAAADAALGAANANPGDTKTETTAVIDYINSHGGAGHRKLNPIWYKASVSNSASTTDQQACAAWTQDSKVFVAASGTPILDECTAKEHAIGPISGAITLEDSAILQKYPADIDLTGMTIDRGMRITIEGLARQGYFAKGAKVGIATWDEEDYHYGITNAAVPALAAVGVRNAPVEYITVPQSYGDLSSTSASVSSAVLKFKQLGIDHVLLFDGVAGVNNSGILVLEWTQQAQSQHYNPRYGLNSTSGFTTLASDYPAQQLVNSIGVGWVPTLDLSSADYPDSKLSPAQKQCLAIMANAGQTATNNNQKGIQFGICEAGFFLKQLFDGIHGPINQTSALAAINALGSSWQPESTQGAFIDRSHHDGATLVQNAAFVPSCTCYRYTSPPYHLD